ncbi:MAG: aminotransferase class I/II-fold pyridoxal phosphate-dependent enzyme [Burkholderiaceae bacterium]
MNWPAIADGTVSVAREHGGPDVHGPIDFDFSVNANACGPCPELLDALAGVDASRYPEGAYLHVREAIARLHDVDAERVVIAGSGSEFIFRMTAAIARDGGRAVSVPRHAYGDYADAAAAWGLRVRHRNAASADGCLAHDAAEANVGAGGDTRIDPGIGSCVDSDADAGANANVDPDADLVWACDPSSPLGRSEPAFAHRSPIVLDCAYEPLRLSGASAWDGATRDRVWRLVSPNKALGSPGVRGAYALAPPGGERLVSSLRRMAPSWVLGAHGVAMLSAWPRSRTQQWLLSSRARLRDWKQAQLAMLRALGWDCLDSDTPFFCARPPGSLARDGIRPLLDALRRDGIKLRDARSFGLDGHLRISVQPPAARRALDAALRRLSSRVEGERA